METRNLRKERVGVVKSNKMNKSVTVSIERKEKHTMYGKFMKKTSTFVAHDESNDCNIGDTVRIMETRPLSKTKNWRVCLLYTSPSPRDLSTSRMPSSA